jgi:hypothetical protein
MYLIRLEKPQREGHGLIQARAPQGEKKFKYIIPHWDNRYYIVIRVFAIISLETLLFSIEKM